MILLNSFVNVKVLKLLTVEINAYPLWQYFIKAFLLAVTKPEQRFLDVYADRCMNMMTSTS